MSKVAVIQMVSGADWQENLNSAATLIAEAAAQGAELVLLPENFAVFRATAYEERGAEEQHSSGPIRQFLAAEAKRNNIWLVGGSIPVLGNTDYHVRAACFVVDNQGVEQARYDKIHLFDVDVADAHSSYRESDQIEPGADAVLVDTPLGKLGLTICYDLRFPLLYQKLVEQGAQLLTVPAAFTKVTGEAHWEVLLRARAIETQCFVLAANQGGQHSKTRATYGHSMIIDPWGRVLASRDEGPGVVVADIDLQAQTEIRRKMPVMQHRKTFT